MRDREVLKAGNMVLSPDTRLPYEGVTPQHRCSSVHGWLPWAHMSLPLHAAHAHSSTCARAPCACQLTLLSCCRQRVRHGLGCGLLHACRRRLEACVAEPGGASELDQGARPPEGASHRRTCALQAASMVPPAREAGWAAPSCRRTTTTLNRQPNSFFCHRWNPGAHKTLAGSPTPTHAAALQS